MYRILKDSSLVLRRLAQAQTVRCPGNRLHCRGYGLRHQLRCVAREYTSSASAEPFLSGSSGTYIEAMYESWQADKTSVHKVRIINI